jgi:hypothetical protein
MQAEGDHPSLRDRLLSLRNDLRQRLAAADVLDGGMLRTLADVETVLVALDRDGAMRLSV